MLWDFKKQLYKEIFFLNFQQVTINVYWQKQRNFTLFPHGNLNKKHLYSIGPANGIRVYESLLN